MGNSVGSLEQLKQTEYDILIGAILGDAHVRKLKTNARVEFTHSNQQKEYLVWKYQQLKRWCDTPPYAVSVYDTRYQRNGTRGDSIRAHIRYSLTYGVYFTEIR